MNKKNLSLGGSFRFVFGEWRGWGVGGWGGGGIEGWGSVSLFHSENGNENRNIPKLHVFSSGFL